jgi:hypothetical protein
VTRIICTLCGKARETGKFCSCISLESWVETNRTRLEMVQHFTVMQGDVAGANHAAGQLFMMDQMMEWINGQERSFLTSFLQWLYNNYEVVVTKDHYYVDSADSLIQSFLSSRAK